MCKLGFKRVLRQNGLTCADVALRYVSDRCSFVELHHYDVSMLPVFEAAGFDSILFMRDPIDLWVSWSVALSTELAHCWPADMQMPDCPLLARRHANARSQVQLRGGAVVLAV